MQPIRRRDAHKPLLALVAIVALIVAAPVQSAGEERNTDFDTASPRTDGIGPFKRLVLRNAPMIDRTGAPAQRPMDLVIEKDRIAEIRTIGAPGVILQD